MTTTHGDTAEPCTCTTAATHEGRATLRRCQWRLQPVQGLWRHVPHMCCQVEGADCSVTRLQLGRAQPQARTCQVNAAFTVRGPSKALTN